MAFFSKLIFRVTGWTPLNALPDGIDRCVMVAAPHTSNWDFIYTRAVFNILEIPLKFTIKKEWMKFPFKGLLTWMGAIPVDRSSKEKGAERKSMVDAMTDLFKERTGKLVVLITPEGSRSRREKWKTGFYWVARNAQVPIVLGFLDYKRKVAGVGKIIYPSGDFKKDMKEIMDFYKNVTPKFPEKFSIDKEFQ